MAFLVEPGASRQIEDARSHRNTKYFLPSLLSKGDHRADLQHLQQTLPSEWLPRGSGLPEAQMKDEVTGKSPTPP